MTKFYYIIVVKNGTVRTVGPYLKEDAIEAKFELLQTDPDPYTIATLMSVDTAGTLPVVTVQQAGQPI